MGAPGSGSTPSWPLDCSSAYAVADVLVVILALLAAASAGWRVSASTYRNQPALAATAVLVALASNQIEATAVDYLRLLAALVLPCLAQRRLGYGVFLLVSPFNILRAWTAGHASLWHRGAEMLAHVIILLTNLDNQEMTTLRRLAAKLSFAHEIHLIRLCRLRELVLGDVWQLPARYRLASIQTEFTYNAGETLFLLRAIVRMVWRPVAPLVILASLLGMLTIVEGHLDRHIYDQLTAPSQYPWYHGILAALYRQILFTARLQHSHICNYIYNELSRAARAIKLELFRLSPTGNSQQVTQDMAWLEWEVDQLHSNLATMLNIVPTAFCAMGTFWSVYNTIGWFALVPIAIHSAIRGAKWGFELLAGPSDAWKAHTTAKYDDTIDEICHGITAIKLFHWERMHLDPKLRQTRFRKAKLPFYAPIVRVVWFIFDTAYDMSFLLSAYPMLYRYTTHRSPGDVELTSGSIYKLNMHISHLCYNAERVSTMLGDSRKAIGGSMSLERILRDKPASTLPRCNAVPVGCNPSVELSDCSFIAGKRSSTPVLKGVSLSAVSGELVAVVGATGSGKSSLLLSICGELEMTKGTGHVSGSIAYLEQSPWIMNDTVRANIVFGRDYNADLFDKIVHACALTDDIARWPSADLTVVSERGINISGGQRARLALARTIYSRADIYVLDDPLSAVDAHVRRHILNHVLLDSGMLAGKLRIVAANTGHIIPYAQKIVTLEDGRAAVGEQVPKAHDPMPTASGPAIEEDQGTTLDSAQSSGPDDENVKSQSNMGSSQAESRTEMQQSPWDNIAYILRLCGFPGCVATVTLALVMPIISLTLHLLRLRGPGASTNSTDPSRVLHFINMLLVRDAVRALGFAVVRQGKMLLDTHLLEKRIKGAFIQSTIRAPMLFFDSTTRQHVSSAYNNGAEAVAAKVLEHFVDNLADTISGVFSIYLVIRGAPQLLLAIPLVALTAVKRNAIIDPVQRMLSRIYRETDVDRSRTSDIVADGRRMIRLFGVGSYFTSHHTQDNDEDARITLPIDEVKVLSASLEEFCDDIAQMVCSWLLVLQTHITNVGIDASAYETYQQLVHDLILGVSVIVSFPSNLRSFSDSISVYRKYIIVEPEALYVVEDCRPAPSWPQAGKIEFRDFTLHYREDLPPALEGINLAINPGEKIGIVGRTGAGKSTLAKSLFRLVHGTTSGSILVDGQDINAMGIGDLRPRLGIIPQESTMFPGSFKRNLDPLLEHTIEDMWAALIKCDIAPKVAPSRSDSSKPAGADNTSDNDVEDSGYNKEYYDDIAEDNKRRWANAGRMMRVFLFTFMERPMVPKTRRAVKPHGLDRTAQSNSQCFSSGEQQLFSLCRLLMRKRHIIVLDEATANVDLATDRHMQQLIRSEFSDCTVLTIAHRLETIMNSDRIIVMDEGRITEIGSPQELIDAGGHFAELVTTNDFGT